MNPRADEISIRNKSYLLSNFEELFKKNQIDAPELSRSKVLHLLWIHQGNRTLSSLLPPSLSMKEHSKWSLPLELKSFRTSGCSLLLIFWELLSLEWWSSFIYFRSIDTHESKSILELIGWRHLNGYKHSNHYLTWNGCRFQSTITVI